MMLAEAQLIWFHPDGLNVEMFEEPYTGPVVRVVLTAMVDFQCREITDSFHQKQQNIILLDEKPGTAVSRNGFDKPVGEMFAKMDDDEIASQELTQFDLTTLVTMKVAGLAGMKGLEAIVL